MRRPWIKIEVCTPDKPEICAIASKLKIAADAVVGKLVRLWSWAELNRVNPNDLSVTKEFLDKLCDRKGFCEALIACGWLVEAGDKLFFPRFARHNGNDSRIRSLTARRVEEHRLRRRQEDGQPIVTKRKLRNAKKTKHIPSPPEPEVTDVTPEPATDEAITELEDITPLEDTAPAPTAQETMEDSPAPPPAVIAAEPIEEPLPEESTPEEEEPIEEPSYTLPKMEPVTLSPPIEKPQAPAEIQEAPPLELDAEAPKPRKGRSKRPQEDDNQPLLF